MPRSIDSTSEEGGMHHAYPAEFLQQLNAGGLPPALLCLKVGSPVILLRNLDPGEGLCNGTRMVVLNMRRKVLQYRIISKDRRFRGKVVLIPRIRLSPNAETLPMPLKRLQFPVRLAFSMTINKCKGITLEVCLVTWVGSYLRAVILPTALLLSPIFPFVTYYVIPLKLLLDLV